METQGILGKALHKTMENFSQARVLNGVEMGGEAVLKGLGMLMGRFLMRAIRPSYECLGFK